MSKSTKFGIALLIGAAFATGGCSLLKGHSKPSTPVLGQRIPVLTTEGDVEIDPATQVLPFSLPAAAENPGWTESGGDASNSMGQLALGNALQPAFTVQAGRGSSLTMRLASPPIVANGRIYTIDTLGAVRAFNAKTGAAIWTSQTPNVKGNESSL
jgi:outer membrane protein assembly factor BamB